MSEKLDDQCRAAVARALERRYARAMKQVEDQADVEVLNELAVGHSNVWRRRVQMAARAICGDPFCRYTGGGLDSDAFRYLARFG